MYQTPLPIWNDIALSQPLFPPMRELFAATPETLPAMIDKHLDKPAEAMGLDDPTALAFRLVMPLFVENEAISAYIEEMRQQQLRSSLPELTTVRECLELAAMEYRLDQSQLASLQRSLVQHAQRLETEAMAAMNAAQNAQ